MKVRAYIRVAKNGYKVKVDASAKEDSQPLFLLSGYKQKTFLPTVKFAVDLNIPDELFSNAAKVIGEINLALENVKIAAEVAVPSELETS